MADAVSFEGTTFSDDWPPPHQSKPLPWRELGNHYSMSAWRLSPEEIAEITRTGVVWVGVQTFAKVPPPESGRDTHPAMLVSAHRRTVEDSAGPTPVVEQRR